MERCVSLHRFSVLFCLGLWLCGAVCGSTPREAPTPRKPLTSRTPPAAGGPRERAAQTPSTAQPKNEEYTLPKDRYGKAIAYSRDSYAMYFCAVLLVVVALLVLLWTGVAAKYRDWAESVSDKKSVQALVFVPLLILTLDLLRLPLRLYGHVLALRYEISVEGWGPWFGDWLKEQALMLVLALLVALGLSAAIRRSPRRWWMYSWLAAMPVAAFLIFITPWFVDPLFSKFEPLQVTQPDLVEGIQKLTAHAGVPIPPERMFLMKASEKTNAIDAYVTGLGASKRVVIWDTTIQKTTQDETLYIVGHELGHYVLGHIWKGYLFFAVLSLVGFYALFLALHWALGRWGGAWKIYGPEDWAALAALLCLLEIGAFLASPVVNAYSRMQEHAADVYGLEVTHGIIPDSAEVAAQSFQILGEADLADPHPSPFITLWLYSHPPIAERMAFAYEYDPWSKGEAPKYVK